jgi:hypothetical protein
MEDGFPVVERFSPVVTKITFLPEFPRIRPENSGLGFG